jgi:hypothetical protein
MTDSTLQTLLTSQGAAAIRLIGRDPARQSGAGHCVCPNPIPAPSRWTEQTSPTGLDDCNQAGRVNHPQVVPKGAARRIERSP